MKVQFISGRNNLALTIMIPFDCPNNCPFCESKKEYAKNRPHISEVINAIKHFFRDNNTLDVPEVVITGGEPMANMLVLKSIINVIPSDKDIYINTTLIKHNFDAFVNLVNNEPQIKGISVSRHYATYERDCKMLHGIVPDDYFDLITKPVRINCVVNSKTNIYEIMNRWEGRNVELSFRENFNTMTAEELHNPYSGYLLTLATGLRYIGHTQCKVCDTTTFKSLGGLTVRYHKGVKNTFIHLEKNKYEINDIIIRQDGKMFCDWDFTDINLLPSTMFHDDTKEIMQRSKARMIEIASTPYHTCESNSNGCGGGGCVRNVRTCGSYTGGRLLTCGGGC